MINVVLVGAGGYGKLYLDALLSRSKEGFYNLTAIIDPYFTPCSECEKLNLSYYDNIEDYFKENSCDLMIISTPIYLHYVQVKTALINNVNVLCEKPLTMDVNQYMELIKLAKSNNKFLIIGYQMAFSSPIVKLKQDLANNVYGNAIKMKTLMLYKRFSDALWYNKKYINNEPIFDSIAGNPGAHYIFNMLYCGITTLKRSAIPKSVQANLMKTGKTETCDIAVLKIIDQNNVPYMYYGGTLVNEQDEMGPLAYYEYEKGVVSFDGRKKDMIGTLNDGTVINYGNPFSEETKKLWDTIELLGKNEKELPFNMEDTINHLKIINAMNKSVESPVEIEEKYMEKTNDKVVVKNIKSLFSNAYDEFDFIDLYKEKIGINILL